MLASSKQPLWFSVLCLIYFFIAEPKHGAKGLVFSPSSQPLAAAMRCRCAAALPKALQQPPKTQQDPTQSEDGYK